MARASKSERDTARGERPRRPEPERTGPVRGAGPRAAPRAGGSATGAPAGIVEQTVDTAYRVFADYLERGRESAARFTALEPLFSGLGAAPQEMATMATRYWSDMARMWLGPFAQMFPWPASEGARPAAPWDFASGRGARAAPEPRRAQAFSVEVIAAQPTEVALDLTSGSEGSALTVQELRAVDGDGKPPLAAVRLESVEGRVRVSLTVPRDQPAGVYSGVVFEPRPAAPGGLADGVTRGTLTVLVRPPL